NQPHTHLGPLQYRKEIIVGSEGYLITISCVRSISFVSLIIQHNGARGEFSAPASSKPLLVTQSRPLARMKG
ncbi:hypothetical protein N9190_00950, partial [bacterium]|nr:hypothetical protein [bacterium]